MSDASPTPPAAPAAPPLALQGVGPLAEGETLPIRLGQSVLLGRSRQCHWSLKRTPAWLRSTDLRREALRRTLGWRATSRRHCRITYLAPGAVDVENLSPNGTLVDGRPIDRVLLQDCQSSPHRIQLGTHGVVLELRGPNGQARGNGHGR